jgi:hypothetical protein
MAITTATIPDIGLGITTIITTKTTPISMGIETR